MAQGKAVTFPGPVAAGDTLVAFFSSLTASCTQPIVTDTLRGGWTLITSDCQNAGQAYAAVFSSTAKNAGPDTVKLGSLYASGLLAVYELAGSGYTATPATPGKGMSDPGTYETAPIAIATPGTVLIGGVSEYGGGPCCILGPGFDGGFFSTGGAGSEFTIAPAQPSATFGITSANMAGVSSWVDVGALFAP
jgi:hypothetical protein